MLRNQGGGRVQMGGTGWIGENEVRAFYTSGFGCGPGCCSNSGVQRIRSESHILLMIASRCSLPARGTQTFAKLVVQLAVFSLAATVTGLLESEFLYHFRQFYHLSSPHSAACHSICSYFPCEILALTDLRLSQSLIWQWTHLPFLAVKFAHQKKSKLH